MYQFGSSTYFSLCPLGYLTINVQLPHFKETITIFTSTIYCIQENALNMNISKTEIGLYYRYPICVVVILCAHIIVTLEFVNHDENV